MMGAAVTFALVLGLREARAFRMWTILESLTGNAALQPVSTPSSRATRTIPPSPGHSTGASPDATQLKIRNLALQNRANDCYANSTVPAVFWTSAQHAGLNEVSMKPVLHDDLCGLLELGSMAPTPLHIWSRQLWCRHLRHWPDTGRQQDAAEFLSFFRQACMPTQFQGAWHIISRNRLLDSGSVCPLVLNCVLEHLPLQSTARPLHPSEHGRCMA